MVRRQLGRGRRSKSSNLRRAKKATDSSKLSNTQRRNKVVLKDMEFWFPLIQEKDLLEVARGKVPLVKNVSEFWKLKPIEQAHLLVGFIKIYRKGRSLVGDRYPNCTY